MHILKWFICVKDDNEHGRTFNETFGLYFGKSSSVYHVPLNNRDYWLHLIALSIILYNIVSAISRTQVELSQSDVCDKGSHEQINEYRLPWCKRVILWWNITSMYRNKQNMIQWISMEQAISTVQSRLKPNITHCQVRQHALSFSTHIADELVKRPTPIPTSPKSLKNVGIWAFKLCEWLSEFPWFHWTCEQY